MSSPAPRAPLFPVPANAPVRSCEENVKALEHLCHVVETKDGYALVHATPYGLARIATELGLPVFPSRKGGEYYAVRVGRAQAVQAVPEAPASASRLVAPQASAPVRHTVDPVSGTSRLLIKGQDYIVRETTPKRRMDVRRWEVRKDGEVGKPYVVSFQSEDGAECSCSCPDWIYRRNQCKHVKGIQAVFGATAQVARPFPFCDGGEPVRVIGRSAPQGGARGREAKMPLASLAVG